MARLGGDEFAVLIDAAADPAMRPSSSPRGWRGAFDDPFAVAGQPMIVGASIGRAMFPDDAQTAEQLLAHADAAMFARKRDRPAVVAAESGRHSGVV